jgi:hypothetical protein
MASITGFHDDWYQDGEGADEMWRLDWNDFQFQLYGQVDPSQVDDYNDSKIPLWRVKFTSFRLFLELDERDRTGDRRLWYACNGWPITAEQAQNYLAADTEKMAILGRAYMQEVYALECDQSMVDRYNKPYSPA